MKPIYSIIIILLNFIDFLSTKAPTDSSLQLPDNCQVEGSTCNKNHLAFLALSELHRQIDDDNDGGVDPVESDGFARGELQYTDGFERTKSLHNDDQHISKEELWNSWINSETYNWTVDDVIHWLMHTVELPQYVDIFLEKQVDGATLPRLALTNMSYITQTLKIKNPVHKQKFLFKAMDLVLFGPPKKEHNYLKDLILAISLLIAVGGCWFAFIQNRFSKQHLANMAKELDSLAKAEKALIDLQQKLAEAEEVKAKVNAEKKLIEQKYKTEIEKVKLSEQFLGSTEDLTRLQTIEQELYILREALAEADRQLEESRSRWLPPQELITLIQITYEMEKQYYSTKKAAAEYQLSQAREMCDKVRKKRNSFLGSLRIAHSNNLDDVEKQITEAKEALDEVRQDLQERQQRWAQIEALSGLQIAQNPGLSSLKASLKNSTLTKKPQSLPKSSSNSSFYLGAVSSFNNLNGACNVGLRHRNESFVRPFADLWKSKVGIPKRQSLILPSQSDE